jgi:hypothetical protein
VATSDTASAARDDDSATVEVEVVHVLLGMVMGLFGLVTGRPVLGLD